MGLGKLQPGCCCCADCTVLADSFDRAELGDDWSVRSGTATITASQLVLSGTAPVVRAEPQADPAHRATASAKGDAAADLRVIVAMADDSNYLYAQLTIDDEEQSGELSLWKVDDGQAEELDRVRVDAPADTLHELTACFEPADLEDDCPTAILQGAALDACLRVAVDFAGGLRAGLAGIGTFDDFRLENARSEDQPRCPRCNCPCKIAFDSFDREDVGPDWEGTASIDDEKLTLVDATAIHYRRASTPAMTVTTNAKAAAGEAIRVIVAWEDDNNYLFGQLRIADEDPGDLSLWRVEDGESQQLGEALELASTPADTLHEITVCFQPTEPEYDSCELTSGTLQIVALEQCVLRPADGFGRQAGLSGTASFEDFRMENAESPVNPDCSPCDTVACVELAECDEFTENLCDSDIPKYLAVELFDLEPINPEGLIDCAPICENDNEGTWILENGHPCGFNLECMSWGVCGPGESSPGSTCHLRRIQFQLREKDSFFEPPSPDFNYLLRALVSYRHASGGATPSATVEYRKWLVDRPECLTFHRERLDFYEQTSGTNGCINDAIFVSAV